MRQDQCIAFPPQSPQELAEDGAFATSGIASKANTPRCALPGGRHRVLHEPGQDRLAADEAACAVLHIVIERAALCLVPGGLRGGSGRGGLGVELSPNILDDLATPCFETRDTVSFLIPAGSVSPNPFR